MADLTPNPDGFGAAAAQLLEPVAPAYLDDPRSITAARARWLARPRSAAQVADLVRLASAHQIPIVPYGGGTGLVGGQVQSELASALILSVERLNAIEAPDPVDRTISVGAGATLADIQAKAAAAGLLFPLSLASEGSCRIGGNLATNAGGVGVLRYGNARELCLGIEAVLPDGSILDGLKPLRKDNTGYDLRHLLIGSEGTLGVITAARLRLFSQPKTRVTALFDIPNPAQAIALLGLLRARMGEDISALELIDRTGLQFLDEHFPDLPRPPVGPGPWYCLVEVASGQDDDLAVRFEAVLGAALEAGIITDGHIAQSEAQRATIWAVRETIPLANRKVGAVSSHDISVAVAELAAFVEEGRAAIARVDPALRLNCFGHVGDGNLHYNVFPPQGAPSCDWIHLRGAVKDCVHDLVHRYGGSISAEHGIGRHKRADLERYGDPAKLTAMRAIKAALDPKGIMNPGAVL